MPTLSTELLYRHASQREKEHIKTTVRRLFNEKYVKFTNTRPIERRTQQEAAKVQ